LKSDVSWIKNSYLVTVPRHEYRFGRTILNRQLEDETAIGSVRCRSTGHYRAVYRHTSAISRASVLSGHALDRRSPLQAENRKRRPISVPTLSAPTNPILRQHANREGRG